MDEELRILTGPNGNAPIVISIGVPTGAPRDINNDTASSSSTRRNNKYICIALFTALLNIITSSAIIYRLKLVNGTDAFSDETKKELQNLTLAQGISLEVAAIMNYVHYLGFRKGGRVKLVHKVYWVASVLIQIWICFAIMGQISLLQGRDGETFVM